MIWFLTLILAERANGLRYPRWGGRRDAVRLGKCWGVEKCLESRQNPQRRVHALLGAVELGDSLAEKDTTPFYLDKLGNCLTNFCTQLNFWQWPKTRFIKTLIIQKPLLTKTFAKQRNLTKEPKQNLPKRLTEENKPISRAYKINREHCRKKEPEPKWPDQKKRQIITSRN